MAPLLHRKVLLTFLSKLRFARDYTKCLGRLALFLAFLVSGHKLSKWCLSRPGKPSTSQTNPQTGRSSTKANSYSASDSPTIVNKCTVAASRVPPSASHPSLHERVERQPATPVVIIPPPGDSYSDHNPIYPLGGSSLVNRSSESVSTGSIHSRGRDPVSRRSTSMDSVQSRASDRISIITSLNDSVRATHDQPPPRATHRQFGRGPDPSRSRERRSWSNLPSSSLVPPSTSSAYTHQPLSPPNEVRRIQSSTSFRLDVQNPSTESLPISLSITNPSITEEPLPMEDSAAAHSSSDSPVVGQHDEPVPGSPTSSRAPTLDYSLPEGRFVQLIISDQIPRYTKDALMQVEYTVPSSHPYISFQTSRGDIL